MSSTATTGIRQVPTYCYNCVSGPDLLTVKVKDGVATEIGPNPAGLGLHPADGKPCVKAYGLIQKTYHPQRILTPMKRSNPNKGMGEDPGFVPISWDEALDAIAAKLVDIRARGMLDEQGLPRIAATFGHGGTPANYMGTFPAFLAALGPIDYSFGSGQGVKCTHSEHLYGEYWHRAFTVSADTPNADYIVSFGANVEVTGGVCAAARHAAARVRGIKRVQIEPHLSVTAAASAEWLPIKPKTDPAFMFAMIHVMLHEHPRERLDLACLRDMTSSPYLVGPHGYYLRDPESGKPLLWDVRRGAAVPHDTPATEPLLEGSVRVDHAVEAGPDGEQWNCDGVTADTAFSKLVAHMQPYSPEWAAAICEVPAAKIRAVVGEFLDHACIGQTVEIDGEILPYRPVAVTLGKTVNNGWGAFECCWSRTVLAVLVGALEVPGGTLGTTVRINKPHDNRHQSVEPGPDGFMLNKLNPTGKDTWVKKPAGRNAHRTLVPLSGNAGAWSQALGPTHLAWMFQNMTPENWPVSTKPEIWIAYRTNPAISFWDTHALAETIARFPFTVCFAFTPDETNHMADILLPDATDLEATQLIRLGKTKYMEQYWQHQGFVLRQPAVAPQGEARDMTWVSTELARRTGLLADYNAAINRGACGVKLKTEQRDFSLDPGRAHSVDEIWNAACKAASHELTGGEEVRDLDWFKEHGLLSRPFKQTQWYLTPTLKRHGLRFELPYQERLMRSGRELAKRMHEAGIHWWDRQLEEYQALPVWHDFPGLWEEDLVRRGHKPEDFPFWLIATKSMQYHSGGNVAIQLMDELSHNIRGHQGVMINTRTAERLGIEDGDLLEINSVIGSTRGPAIPIQGIRPDTLVIVGQFDHWATPYAKDLKAPSLNTIAPMSIELTDATGSGADVVRVALRRLGPGGA
ncbi:dimethylsulfide dehydrogenase subunit alpha precursor [mine drainage metagenome]|uniref:Dimethylsulfide dehydrogenase subunit alpha n=1 Tax=mine drainage metagenome TaxID=410659 RepID=A0A1J5RYR3_9ZZZZ